MSLDSRAAHNGTRLLLEVHEVALGVLDALPGEDSTKGGQGSIPTECTRDHGGEYTPYEHLRTRRIFASRLLLR